MGQGYVEGWVGFGIVSVERLLSASRELAVRLTFSINQLLCLKPCNFVAMCRSSELTHSAVQSSTWPQK